MDHLDQSLFNFIDETLTTKFNPLICNGLAVEHLKYAEDFLDGIIRCAAKDFPPGLSYDGMFSCLPEETYAEITRKKNSKRMYEITRSDTYMVKLMFSWQGERMTPRNIFLPFVTRGGLMRLRGALFAVSHVFADRAVSVGANSLFIPLTKAKLTLERLVQNVYVNQSGSEQGVNVNGLRESVYVIWSQIYHRSKKSLKNQGKPTINANTTLAHYLFCKYGVTEAFHRFASSVVHIGYEDTINEANYPPSEWCICTSTQHKPKGLGKILYQPSFIRLAVKRSEWKTPMVSGLVAGFFYCVDHFPSRITPELIDEVELWRVLLGHIIFASNVSEAKLALDVEPHMESLDSYVDYEARDNLATDGVYVDDFYELLAHVIDTFSSRLMNSSDSIASMYDKRLTLLRYILSPLTHSIFRLMFALKHNKAVLNAASIHDKMNKTIKPELIMGINHDHGEVRPILSSSDNMMFNITTATILQTNSSGGGSTKTKDSLIDPSKFIHASVAEVGSFSNLQKSDPSGRGRLNPTVQIDAHGNIIRDESKRELLERTQAMLKR
jgi:hypothetical protein